MTERPVEKKKSSGGRPTIYSQELADLICMRVATTSFGIRKLSKMFDEFPAVDTIYQWRYKYKSFSEQYAAAKLKQAEFMAEEIIEIADDGTNDWMATLSADEQGMGWRINGEHTQRSRLRVDTRKWLAAKLLPKTYGDMIDSGKSTTDSLIERLADKLNK